VRVAEPEPTPPTGVLDVTEFVLNVDKQIKELAKAREDDHALIVQLAKQNKILGEMVQAGATANAALLAPLAKAIADQRIESLRTPAAPITPVGRARGLLGAGTKAAERHAVAVDDAKLIGGNSRLEMQALAKALRTGVIDHQAKQTFATTRKFCED